MFVLKRKQKLLQSGTASTTFYFKMGQTLFQTGVAISISKRGKAYFKEGQKLFQSGVVISKWGKLLFQSGAIISKRGNYYITSIVWWKRAVAMLKCTPLQLLSRKFWEILRTA